MVISIYFLASIAIFYFCSKEHRIFVGLMLLGLFLIFAPYKSLDEFQLLGYRLDTDKYNELGDFVGGVVGTFFSIIAVYFLYKTYNTQRQELTTTRNLLLKQQFESTFFSMLNIHSQNIEHMSTLSGEPDQDVRAEVKGRRCFYEFIRFFQSAYNETSGVDNSIHIKKAYKKFYLNNQEDVGHYFRTFYHILKFIDSNDELDKDSPPNEKYKSRRIYAGIVRAQLSSDELVMLFYNCLSSYATKTKILVERYSMLQNMPQRRVMTAHLELYDKKAYGSAYRSRPKKDTDNLMLPLEEQEDEDEV